MAKSSKKPTLKESFSTWVDNQPRGPREIAKEVKLFIRALSALIFLILGFSFSRSAFFNEYPMFGYNFIIEVFVALLCGLFGFFIFPVLIVSTKAWIENLITKSVANIVANFWDLQTRKIQEARREKQRRKSQSDAEKVKQVITDAVLVDTSVLVDGRIVDILKTGFFDKTLIIPQFVINELHLISDNKDKIKRQRGRRGLDVIKEVKKYTKIVTPETKDSKEGVDKQLIVFAKENNVKLLTLDFNLNKVANISNVKVLNINDLVNAIKTVLLPGEEFTIKIIQEGKEKEQGVGYMTDGTMIVVDKAKSKVGEEVTAKVAKVIQSAAGKIIFCELVS